MSLPTLTARAETMRDAAMANVDRARAERILALAPDALTERGYLRMHDALMTACAYGQDPHFRLHAASVLTTLVATYMGHRAEAGC